LGYDTQLPLSWQVDLPDGEGYYEFYTQASDIAGNTESKTQAEIYCAYDNTEPEADAGESQDVRRGTTVSFDGSGSSDNGKIQSYEWTFTDGTIQTLTGDSPTYTFDTAGSFQITLTVTDAAGFQDVHVIWVNVTVRNISNNGLIRGRVLDEKGKPLEGARVSVTGRPFFTKTDENGYYAMEDIPQGTYDLDFTRDGFQTRTISGVSVSAGQETMNQDVILPKAAVEPKPFLPDYWWVFVLAAMIAVFFIVFALMKKNRSKETQDNPQESYGIHTLENHIEKAEENPVLPPQPAPGYTANAPPPPPPPPPEPPAEYGENHQASDSED
jgi:PKD repeat protein